MCSKVAGNKAYVLLQLSLERTDNMPHIDAASVICAIAMFANGSQGKGGVRGWVAMTTVIVPGVGYDR